MARLWGEVTRERTFPVWYERTRRPAFFLLLGAAIGQLIPHLSGWYWAFILLLAAGTTFDVRRVVGPRRGGGTRA